MEASEGLSTTPGRRRLQSATRQRRSRAELWGASRANLLKVSERSGRSFRFQGSAHAYITKVCRAPLTISRVGTRPPAHGARGDGSIAASVSRRRFLNTDRTTRESVD